MWKLSDDTECKLEAPEEDTAREVIIRKVSRKKRDWGGNNVEKGKRDSG